MLSFIKHISSYLKSKPQSRFDDSHIVWKYLSQIPLNIPTENLLKKSFRTRIKYENNIMIFQFRISPDSLSEWEKIQIKIIEQSLKNKLQSSNRDKAIEVQIKTSNCWGSNCWGCREYQKNII